MNNILEDLMIKDEINKAKKILESDEMAFINLRYDYSLTFEEIGKIFNITRERAKRKLIEVENKLKKQIKGGVL